MFERTPNGFVGGGRGGRDGWGNRAREWPLLQMRVGVLTEKVLLQLLSASNVTFHPPVETLAESRVMLNCENAVHQYQRSQLISHIYEFGCHCFRIVLLMLLIG